MKRFQLTYTQFSETSILVQWPQKIAPQILEDVLQYQKKLSTNGIPSIVQVINAYNSLLVCYDSYIKNFIKKKTILESVYDSMANSDESPQTLWKIPVCYDAHFGLDLEGLSNHKRLTVSDIIGLHSEVVYKVYFIGFLPGFLYLGGLDPKLFTSRKESPRQHIEKGAVAIGGQQTGIYPNSSPGGWQIIGNSPLEFFNPQLKKPCFASAGDSIQFVPIELETHQEILRAVKAETYSIESEVIYG